MSNLKSLTEPSFVPNVSNKTCFLLCFFQVGFWRPSKAFQVRPLKALGGLQKAFGGLLARTYPDFASKNTVLTAPCAPCVPCAPWRPVRPVRSPCPLCALCVLCALCALCAQCSLAPCAPCAPCVPCAPWCPVRPVRPALCTLCALCALCILCALCALCGLYWTSLWSMWAILNPRGPCQNQIFGTTDNQIIRGSKNNASY